MLCCQLILKDFKAQIPKSLKQYFQKIVRSNHNRHKDENKAKTYQQDKKNPRNFITVERVLKR